MAAETPNAADLNVQEEEVQTIHAPMRSTPGGGAEQMGGPMRAAAGSAAEALGGDQRQVAGRPEEGQDDAPTGDAPDPNAGKPAGENQPEAPAGEAGGEQPEGGATGEGPQAALQAALAELPQETQDAFKPYQEAFEANGTLTPEETTAAAAALGVPEALVKFHLAAIQAGTPAEAAPVDPIQGELIAAAYEVAGSKENYAPFRAWLESEGRTEDIQVLTDALDAKSPSMLKRLMGPLVAEFKASGLAPNTRRDITSEGGVGETAADAVEGYANKQEQFKEMRAEDPKRKGKRLYDTDPAYRDKVNKRIVASSYNGPR